MATAGHVDHGKSTLVRALTGTDPDRLEEEKRRGLTIELGFARMLSPSGVDVHLVDVPGHVRFIKTMLAGVGAVDACLLVVAATEGWKPQTEEHLRILELLGVRHGVVAVTMGDRVGADRRDLTLGEVTAHLAGTFLEDAEVVVVGAPLGLGLDDLRAAIDRLVDVVPVRRDEGRPRLWIDRAFALPGAGTVVTGTLVGGALAVDDEIVVSTRRGLLPGRIRSLQSFGADQQALEPGCRAALNLAGIGHRDVRRGDAVVQPGHWHHTSEVDASLVTLASLAKPVRSAGAYIAYIGSAEHPVRLRLLGAVRELRAGAEGLIRLRTSARLPLVSGDRFVLRDTGSGTTVGGGEILDVSPTLPASRARPDRSVDRVIAERGWVEADELYRLTGVHRAPVVGRWVVDPAALEDSARDLRVRVESAPSGIDVSALDEQARALVEADEDLTVTAGRVLPACTADALASHPYLDVIAGSPFAPPSPDEAGVPEDEVRELLRRRLVVKEQGIVFSTTAMDQAATVAARLLAASPEGISVSDLRTALRTSRRFALALLAMMDRNGLTRRRGDLRVAGPRLLTHST